MAKDNKRFDEELFEEEELSLNEKAERDSAEEVLEKVEDNVVTRQHGIIQSAKGTDKLLPFDKDEDMILRKESSYKYIPGAINRGRGLSLQGSGKKRVLKPNVLNRNIGFGSRGFVGMAGLGAIIAVSAIIILMLIFKF